MKKYELNIENSKEVYDTCKKRIAVKMCYNNVFNVVTDYFTKFKSKEWKVAYGYMTVMDNLLCRHCFIIDSGGEVIDPTIYVQNKPNEHRCYWAFKVFDDVDNYLDAIHKENFMPELGKLLKEENKQAYKWAEKNHYILIG